MENLTPKNVAITATFDPSIFEIDQEKQLVNLTKIGNHFGKLVANWTKAQQTKDFLQAFSEMYPDIPNGITVIQGGNLQQGTWAVREIALEFAQWISPKFKVFCIKKLDELFQTGKTTLRPKDLSRLEILQIAVEAEKENEQLKTKNQNLVSDISLKELTIKEQETQLKVSATKVQKYNEFLEADGVCATTILASILNIRTAKVLNETLYQKGIIKKINGTWVLRAEYNGLGYAKMKEFIFSHSDGRKETKSHLYWTPKGIDFVSELLHN